MGLIPGSGRVPGEGNGNPLQYTCLGIPMDRMSQADYSPRDYKKNLVTKQQQERHNPTSSQYVACFPLPLKKKKLH